MWQESQIWTSYENAERLIHLVNHTLRVLPYESAAELDSGLRGDLLDIHVALSPCTIGYAEIGSALRPALEKNPDHPYADWIREYSSEPFQRVARDSAAYIDELGERYLGDPEANPQRFAVLAQTFATAVRMESAFWQMGLDLGAAEQQASQ